MILHPTSKCLRNIYIGCVATIFIGFLLISYNNGNRTPMLQQKASMMSRKSAGESRGGYSDPNYMDKFTANNGSDQAKEYMDKDRLSHGNKNKNQDTEMNDPYTHINNANNGTDISNKKDNNSNEGHKNDNDNNSAIKNNNKDNVIYDNKDCNNNDNNNDNSNQIRDEILKATTVVTKEDSSSTGSSSNPTSTQTTTSPSTTPEDDVDIEKGRIAAKPAAPISNNEAAIYSNDSIEMKPEVKQLSSMDPETLALITQRFKDRNEKIEQVCQAWLKSDPDGETSPRRWNINVQSEVADLKWCQIPKVGTTFMKYLRNNHPELQRKKGKKNEQQQKVKRFYFVRDPYSRLVSGFMCKIVLTPAWWPLYGKPIVQKFRSNPSEKSVRCGNDATFPEFIKYFIYAQENNWKKNNHFTPIHEQCYICRQKYDYVGHLETYTEDFRYMLNSVNVTLDININHDERELRGKVFGVLRKKERIEKCEPICSTLRKLWWSFHMRGFISIDMKFPLDDSQCSTIAAEEFADIAWSAHLESLKTMDKSKQKQEAMASLFLQVPLKDRLKVQKILTKDFQMFGYDPQPPEIFPELVKR